MMNSEFFFREKVSVGILGATGTVGQKFVQLLSGHPWFEITALGASEKSAGKTYREAVNWQMPVPIPPEIADMKVLPCTTDLPADLVFSGLDSNVAGPIETDFANAGFIVLTNSKNHRMDKDVPLLVPEVNADHLPLVKTQTYQHGGLIIANPNCSTVGLVIALKPLIKEFGVEKVHVVTLQAISGAGYPGVPSLDIIDNVIPYIPDEELKMQTESKKILGELVNNEIKPLEIAISAQCNRVPVTNGHMECVSIKLKRKVEKQELIKAWQELTGLPQDLDLPSAPEKPILYYNEENYPQPKLHRESSNGMVVSIGRLNDCPVLDYKFTLLSHNTIRGAAGGAILNAELMLKSGYIYW
jgi:aspartate-semialdehyde dehydrogenase